MNYGKNDWKNEKNIEFFRWIKGLSHEKSIISRVCRNQLFFPKNFKIVPMGKLKVIFSAKSEGNCKDWRC